MRHLCLIIFAFLLAYPLMGQQFKYQPNYKKPIKVNPKLIKPIILKSDLTVVDNIRLVTQNGRRYLYAEVKNIGNINANRSRLQLKIRWRVDYEQFTNVERTRNYTIPALRPGQQHTLCVSVPDHEIRTNEGFGSNHAAFYFRADAPNQIAEIKENNNTKTKHIPVLRP